MAEAVRVDAAQAAAARAFLTFKVDGRLYALPAERVSEVVATPAAARVPQAPESLLGIGNLRGAVLPVVDARILLGRDRAAGTGTRAIILQGAAALALVVDSVDALVTVDAVETDHAEIAADAGERLAGAFRLGAEQAVVRILDIQALLNAVFVQRAAPQRQARAVVAAAEHTVDEADDRATLITFDVAGQEFGFDLKAVHEIISAPEAVTVVPRAEALVLGVTAYRDALLPLFSLRGLLGFAAAADPDGRAKVLVTSVNGVRVGLLTDRMRSIVRVDPDLVEPTPPVLAARTGGEAKIGSIYRGDGGGRLISILAPEQLFREDVMQRLAGAGDGAGRGNADAEAAGDELQFLVFSLGEDEFALPIGMVDEVARVPHQITRVPKAPKFLEGVVNLRGEVLPVVDQRRRFGMPVLENDEGRRLVVVRTESHRAGLIVDSVSEVLRSRAGAIEPVPELTEDMSRLVQGVINLESAGRIVLVLDPQELLSRAERGLLDAFEAETAQALP